MTQRCLPWAERKSVFLLAHTLVMSFWMLAFNSAQTVSASPYFGIRVVDAQTGRGVPLVELETVNHLRWVTDSNGWVAFHEPGLMGQRVFFFRTLPSKATV